MGEDAIKSRELKTLYYSMGNEILTYLKDHNVFELMVNADGKLWVDTFADGRVYSGVILDASSRQQILFQVASMTKQVVDENHPMLEAELPDGSRFQGFFPRVVKAPAFVIRKHSSQVFTLEDYVEQGVMTPHQRDVIVDAVKAKKNIIAAGGTKSGKTTLLNAILAEISKTEDRIVLIEDMPELQCTAENYLPLRTSPHASMDDLLRSTLRATPDRIVVGEVRSGEALALLDAWSTGHSGGCSTVHSNSAYQTLLRLQKMISRVSMTPQQETIGEAVDMVVYLARKGTGRIIQEVLLVEGYDEKKQMYKTKNIAN